jgi:hypothetical protein
METLTKILEKLGEGFAWVGWMYGAPGVPAPALVPPPAEGRPLMDTAALVDRMVDCFNRQDPEAPAACYAPDARVHPPAGRRRSTLGPGWPPFLSS